jgi:hypothetical protein
LVFAAFLPKPYRSRKGSTTQRADQVIAYTQKCVVVPLHTATALLAADLHPSRHAHRAWPSLLAAWSIRPPSRATPRNGVKYLLDTNFILGLWNARRPHVSLLIS